MKPSSLGSLLHTIDKLIVNAVCTVLLVLTSWEIISVKVHLMRAKEPAPFTVTNLLEKARSREHGRRRESDRLVPARIHREN